MLLRKLWKFRAGILGLGIVAGVCGLAIFAGSVSPHDPYDQEIANRLTPPAWAERGSSAHLLGTDPVGRDILSRLIYGGQISLATGVVSVLIAASIGIVLGLLGGYYGGAVDSVINNLVNTVIVTSSLEVARMIIQESFLSFLGLGVQPPTPSWGGMLGEGRTYMLTHPWLATFPGLAIFVTTLGINLLGDGLRDLLDPHRY